MKSNLYINTGEELWKKPKFPKNRSTKFNSLNKQQKFNNKYFRDIFYYTSKFNRTN